MASRTWFFPLWICTAALLGMPEETSRSVHSQAASVVTSMLHGTSASTTTPPSNEAVTSWAEEREEEYQSALFDAKRLQLKYPYLVANVIFQTNTPWSNAVWIDVGKETQNSPFHIEKNCPVIVQDTLVGIIDYVGSKSSRVRLLSDPSVKPAVRVVRGNAQIRQLVMSAQEIKGALETNPALLPKPELASTLSKLLDCMLQSLPAEAELRLAKGELQGAEYPTSPTVLRGVGFNYDFGDEEGPPRDLRNGQRSVHDQKILLIKPGDLLETSGLDGVFPKGLRVATVLSVFPLEEGAISYRILAKIESSEFPNFEHLTIISAQPQDPLHPPTHADIIKELIEKAPA